MRLLPSLPLLTRDKADTLLLIAACLLVLLPHASHVDWWVNLGCALLLVWRSWLTLNGRRLPPAWILLPVSAAMMGGVYLTHHTFFGREAGVTMLVLLLTCKLLEMHAKRDLFVVIYLGFFLLLTSFFYQQTIGTAFITLLAVSLLLTAQLSFHYTGTIPSLLQRLKLGLTIVGLAIPLTIVAFFLFPRIQGPLWGLPGDAHAGRSGLSDSMTPGTISDLALSDDIAFRVRFTGAVPNKSLLYWRGIVLNYFDGKSWSRGRSAPFTGSTIASVSGPEIRQQIILEPNGQRWLFALDVPAAPPILENNAQSTLNLEMESRSAVPLFQRLRYAVRSYPQYRLRAEASAAELGDSLELPANYNPRTLAFAAELRQRYGDDRQLMSAVLQYFRHEPFAYTLEPPLLGINSVDDFLFSTRAGFCEH
ncbi:MAG: DUF3488 domain-containing protein, partial [Burkholderiales bacterium]|nr:DUF3488 domain-containing protein [Burkholderiales bacterium]